MGEVIGGVAIVVILAFAFGGMGNSIVTWIDRDKCEVEHNVYFCKRSVVYTPVYPDQTQETTMLE